MNKIKLLQSRLKVLLKRKNKRVVHDEQLMHPDREWVVGLIIAVLLFIAAAGLSTYLYVKNRSVEVSATPDKNDNTVYRESLVKEALESIKQKEEEYSSLTTGTAVLPPQEEIAPPEEVSASSTVPVTEEISAEPSLPTLGD